VTEPTDEPENEIVAEAKRAAAVAKRAKRAKRDRALTWQIGAIGVGAAIGSAAVAGAVLYATRRDRDDD
jgi:hypothetical protein